MEPKYIFFGCEDSAAAAEFTQDRIEKIRQVKEEIQFAIMAKEKAELEDWHRGWMPVAERLIAARQAALAELCVGVKPEVLNGR
jgi:predicted DNA-binding transcriptional regulator YafY